MSTSSVDPTYYADFGGLESLKKSVKADDTQAIRAAAQQFESLFTNMVLKSMREAKLGEGLGESDGTNLYTDMYDQQLSLQMSQGHGLGLADMLVQQLTRGKAGAKE
jgi:flagellar protein FlgJ